jgi:ABC-2 type transport system permease protein
MQPLASISPATYVLEGMRRSLLHGAGIRELMPFILILILIGLICVPAGMLIFSWGEGYAKRTGKLKRSG